MDILKPDLGKIVYAIIGFIAVPKLLKLVKR